MPHLPLDSKIGQPLGLNCVLHETFMDAFVQEPTILQHIACDMIAVNERDPACPDILTPLLYFKGLQALVCYRVSHYLWHVGRTEFALYLQSLTSETFAVDIHPAPNRTWHFARPRNWLCRRRDSRRRKRRVILHEVTLGGTGKDRGDRHPKVRSGVLLVRVPRYLEMSRSAKVPKWALAALCSKMCRHTRVLLAYRRNYW